MLCSSFKVTKDCESGVASLLERGETEIDGAGVIIILIEFPYPGHIKPRKEGYLDLDTLTVRRLTHVQPRLRLFRSFCLH